MITVQEAASEYIEHCDRNGLDYATIKDYRNTLKEVAEAIGSKDSEAVSQADIERIKAGFMGSGATRAKKIRHIKRFFSWLQDMDYGKDVAKAVKAPRFRQEPTMPFAAEELRLVLSVEEPETRAICLLLLYSGLRISDAILLKRSDVQDGCIRIWTEKTGKAVTLRLHRDCLAALEAIPGERYLMQPGDSFGAAYQRVLAKLKAIGEEIRPHRFRDTFACRLLSQGTDIRTVQHLLGHASVTTTEKHYAPWVKAYQDQMDKAIGTLEWTEGKEKAALSAA